MYIYYYLCITELQYKSRYERDSHVLNVIFIILDIPCLSHPEYVGE